MSIEERMGDASRQGKAFEETVCLLLLVAGWTIIDRRWKEPFTGYEIDIVAKDPSGETWWIECKGSWKARDNGLERGDTVKKAIGVAAVLSRVENRSRYWLITSHIPRTGTVGHRALELVDCFDKISVVGFIDVLGSES